MPKIKCNTWDGYSIRRYAHVKLDGNYTRIEKDISKYGKEFGGIRIFSSQDTDLTEQIKTNCEPNWLVSIYKRVPDRSILLGELYYPGEQASYIKTGVVNGDKSLRFAGFALGEQLPGTSLEDIQSKYLLYGLEFAPYIRLTVEGLTSEELKNLKLFTELANREKKWNKVWNQDSLLGEHLQVARQRKDITGLIEGWVLKNANMLDWAKIKEEKTIDCFICGYNPGYGKYIGKVGSVIVGVYDIIWKPNNSDGKYTYSDNKFVRVPRIIADVGGFADNIRDWLSKVNVNTGNKNIINLINNKQVVEVRYQYTGSEGRLRHPRFKRFREDKNHEECYTDQDEDLRIFCEKNR